MLLIRVPDDEIWDLWESDVFAGTIGEELGLLLEEYDSKSDVI